MSVQPQQFLEFAENLLESPEEIDIRNIISRAYYASYHTGKPVGNKFPLYADVTGGAHAQFVSRFKEHRDIKVRTVGFLLNTCLSDRRLADYELGVDLSLSDAKLSLSQNKRLIDLLADLDKKY